MMQFFPFVLLRSPLQSLDKAFDETAGMAALFAEGLYLSSPEFWQLYREKENLAGKNKDKFTRAFTRYWLRSCTRCTPYGTFAGTAQVPVTAETTSLVLGDSATYKRSVRLDMNYLAEMARALTQLPVVRNQIKFFINNSLYSSPYGFRYAEYFIQDNVRNYYLTAIEKTTYLEKIVQEAEKGATLQALINLLVETEDVDETEALEFLEELCAVQVLIPETEPCVTGQDPFSRLVAQLEKLAETELLVKQLQHIRHNLRHPAPGVSYYLGIEQQLKRLDLGVEMPRNTLQTDLFLSMQQPCINRDLLSAIVQQAADICLLARKNKSLTLEDFRKKFYNRYEAMEMPLLTVLDADLGIGYAGVHDEAAGSSALIDDLHINGQAKEETITVDYIQEYVFRKYHDYLQHNKPCIDLQEAELKGLAKHTAGFRFPGSMYLLGSLMQQEGQLDATHFVFDLAAFSGPSAANLLGRFTQGDEQLADATRAVLQEEEKEYPDAIYAEIVHQPQARIGNVLLRPVLREYEIPYVGWSGAAKDKQIPVTDLMVSVKGEEVILRSKTLNRRIIPRLSAAHNYAVNSLPVYRFLCDLQGQGLAYPNVWDWGQLASLQHLPRVTYKNLVIRKARWKIKETDMADLPVERSAYTAYFEKFRSQWHMPEQVVYAEHDNELLIDFRQERCIDCLLHFLHQHKTILLEEFLFTRDNCIVHDAQHAPYTNELIIPLFRPVPVVTGSIGQQDVHAAVKRKFYPDSEWSYFKLYGGPKTIEKVLQENLQPFIEQGIAQQLFERFFFIRYKDEFPHLRIRFYNSDAGKQSQLQEKWKEWLQPLLNAGLFDKVMMDTYTRELERYGATVIDEVEQLFYHDSIAILKIIQLLDGDEAEQYRLLLALRGIDFLLEDFGVSLPDKTIFAGSVRSSFFTEFGAAPVLQKQLNEKYRQYQQRIFSHMNEENDTLNGITEAIAAFRRRSEMNRPVIAVIQQQLRDPEWRGILPALVHMFMNRLFIAEQRKYELVLYHFLEKYYASQLAIARSARGRLQNNPPAKQ